jgi:tetratricopeptide (TPR) repeat protein
MIGAERARELHATALAVAKKGGLAQAVPLWGEALRLAPDDVDVLVHLGHALAACGERERAAELATRAARLAPQTASPWLLLGHLGVDAGEWQTALESYALAERFALPAELEAVAVAKARVLRRAGRLAEARGALAQVTGDGVETLILRGQLAADAGDVDDARALLVQAGERDPDHPEPYKALASLCATSDPALARELASHALELAPHDLEAQALVAALSAR